MKIKIRKWIRIILGWLFLTLAISIALAMAVYIRSEKEAQKPGNRFYEIAGPGLLMSGIRQGMSAPLRNGIRIEERSLNDGFHVTSMALPASTTDLENAPANVIRRSRSMGAEEREQFSRPPASYETGDGTVYELVDWRVECIPGGIARHDMEREMTYQAVEAAQTVPGQLAVREEFAGEQAEGTLHMVEKERVNERWTDDFRVPVTFHSYGAEQYQLGDILLAAGEQLPPPQDYQAGLFRVLGLSDNDYRVTGMHWEGEPYVDTGGELCRDALAVGEKRVADYRVLYAGPVSWPVPDTYELKTVYKLQRTARTDTGSGEVPSGGPRAEGEDGGMDVRWYWVREWVEVTVTAGLIGILLGTLILLISWRREKQGVGSRSRASGPGASHSREVSGPGAPHSREVPGPGPGAPRSRAIPRLGNRLLGGRGSKQELEQNSEPKSERDSG